MMRLVILILISLSVLACLCRDDKTCNYPPDVQNQLHSDGDSNVNRLVRSVMEKKPYLSNDYQHRKRRSAGDTMSEEMEELVQLTKMLRPLLQHYLPNQHYSIPPTNDDLVRLKLAIRNKEKDEHQRNIVINILNSV
ncbi:hypothetical protein Pcinc_017573 [Petrolisthes cinctipes]|uniref:Uncharacterized protein n=1 Tax=Petrolisthes cinctipes TaxID=88211 RepID=A0AAE1FQF2_PETCI|nr:hypothetical protein Pcinc_017573 [Petrolisthes cinctipes]